ncbi:HpsJ family protein [Acaryochloris sp. IP29b_bin.137]|uniref:HpsJ-like protein, cyanoexosortase A-associated n=1 Tax=Acaryochloris sp. IP29b_bin.137 TaxID=2969217 RepID=UPI00261E89DD|nr:HpsJ family protein [Acaryochloris sp. IP29b_bin.137]
MTQSKLDRLWRSYATQSRSTTLIRWLGYGLLLLAFLDLGAILIPFRLMDPMWEFRSIGDIVERIPVPLIGFVMVFWGEQEYRRPGEKIVVKLLTWMTLCMALVLFALIPLCMVNSQRIHNSRISRVSAFQDQRLALVQQLENKLRQTNSVDEFQMLLSQALNNRLPANFDSSQPLSEIKVQLPALLDPARSEIKRQAQVAREQHENARPSLLKHSVKWSLGALIGAVISLRIWQSTRWARKKSYL